MGVRVAEYMYVVSPADVVEVEAPQPVPRPFWQLARVQLDVRHPVLPVGARVPLDAGVGMRVVHVQVRWVEPPAQVPRRYVLPVICHTQI